MFTMRTKWAVARKKETAHKFHGIQLFCCGALYCLDKNDF